MKSKTLTKITWYFFLWSIGYLIIFFTDVGRHFLLLTFSMRQLVVLYVATLIILFILIASRILSYMALSIHKGQKLNALIFGYRSIYIFLTDEARQEWRDFIAIERARIRNQDGINI